MAAFVNIMVILIFISHLRHRPGTDAPEALRDLVVLPSNAARTYDRKFQIRKDDVTPTKVLMPFTPPGLGSKLGEETRLRPISVASVAPRHPGSQRQNREDTLISVYRTRVSFIWCARPSLTKRADDRSNGILSYSQAKPSRSTVPHRKAEQTCWRM